MKKMYKGKVNSPATLLVETIDSSVTSIKVADGTVFPEGPNVAVIGTDGNAETIKYDSINGNILVGCVRGFQGKVSVWDKDTIIARNFTEYDLDALQENILELDKKELKDFQEDENHRTVTDSEKEKWNDKVDQSQITGDVSASGSDKVYHVDFIKKQFNSLDGNKAEKSEIPTKLSQLINDKTFKTEAEIQELINNSTKLKKEVVTSLPATGKEDVIYLLKNKNDTNNVYTEYMWIDGKWEIIGDTKVDLTDYAKKSDIKTKLSEMLEDNTHRTVSDSEKQSWNKKFELPQGKENQVLTKTTNGAEFKEVSSSRSATFVIANYDSSENSKSGADYVIQESDCAAEIINGFITKLPSYGGKIQLTEGNFNIKKNLTIGFIKNNTIIEGYGNATTIIDKLTKDERNLVIVNISPGVTNCRLSDLNITHDTGNSINIRGNKNYIKSVNVINNGTYSSVYFNDNTSENVLENCNVESHSHCYWTDSMSENNKILNCSGTSINNSTFYIDGPNNLILNCSGISDKSNAFAINNSGIRLIGCKAKTNPNTSFSDIWFTSSSKSCISLANQYYKKCSNEGSNNIVVNNTKLGV